MDSVKTYQNVNAENQNVNFRIAKMEEVFTKRKGKVDDPHRHNFYTVLIINKANGLHKIDFNAYEMGERQLFFVAPGQVHQVIERENSYGYAMTFATEFLVENSIPLSFIESLNLFQNYGQSPPLQPLPEKFDQIERFAQQMFDLYEQEPNMKNLSLGAFLKLILIECNNLCAINPIESQMDHSGDNLIRNFKALVDQHFRTNHSTNFYADLLNITSDHLNRTVKSKIGKTSKEYIQSRIITEAKRLLFFSDLSSKEVGYELGFNEPANFSAFFKKHVNISPSNFKNKEFES